VVNLSAPLSNNVDALKNIVQFVYQASL